MRNTFIVLCLAAFSLSACEQKPASGEAAKDSTLTFQDGKANLATAKTDLAMPKTKKFVHVVNFYLKKDLSAADIKKFEDGVTTLGTIETVQVFNVGKPASTDRPVIDKSYSYCLVTVFKDKAGHDVYQEAPIHLKFIEECSSLWEKVVIFDSETIDY